MFSGLVYCADCGSKLYYSSYNKRKANAASFRCSLFTKDTELCTMHYIRESAIYNLVLEDMKRVDTLIQILYEDNALGKLSDERYATMSISLETEQKELKDTVPKIEKELNSEANEIDNLQTFIGKVKRITQPAELTPELVHEFIEKIVVSAPTKINGKRYQQVDIYYNGVGVIKQPTAEEWEQQFQNKYLNTKEKTA